MMVRYGAIFGKRYTVAQKIRFLTSIEKDFQAAGYTTAIMRAKQGSNRIYNLYVGDVDHADTIITTYYDTPSKSFGLIPYMPLTMKQRGLAQLLVSFVPFLVIVLCGALFVLKVVNPVWGNGILDFWDGLVAIGLAVFIVAFVKNAKGIPNRFNVVRNSSGVIACLDLAQSLNPAQRKQVAFALTDYGALNRFGEVMLKDQIGDGLDKKQVILLDSIGGTGDIFVGYSHRSQFMVKPIKDEWIKKVDCEPDDRAKVHFYKQAIVLTTGKLEGDRVIRDRVSSRQDIELNEENYRRVVTTISAMIDR